MIYCGVVVAVFSTYCCYCRWQPRSSAITMVATQAASGAGNQISTVLIIIARDSSSSAIPSWARIALHTINNNSKTAASPEDRNNNGCCWCYCSAVAS